MNSRNPDTERLYRSADEIAGFRANARDGRTGQAVIALRSATG
jgi:hypothetical protein